MKTRELVDYLDEYLNARAVPDSANALNGLQVENRGEVSRIAAAVDASERAIGEAVHRGCTLLLVHHGMLWDGNVPITGRRYRKLRLAVSGDLAIYASHLPLDVHPEVGNNIVLAKVLGVEVEGRFGAYQGVELGVRGRLEIRREALAARLHDLLGGPVRFLAGGPERVNSVAVVTGAASSLVNEAVTAGIDAFVTGEGPHHSYFDAMEGGINVYYGGHYATETWGVKALAEHLGEKFGVPWEFIDQPTGF
jgi:dinuclear metal center YbgI/SA1388 family protein